MHKNYVYVALIITGIFICHSSVSQVFLSTDTDSPNKNLPGFYDEYRGGHSIRVLFYNVENLFDTKDDSLTNDDEYAPGGIRGWNYTRFNYKLEHLYKTLISAGGWEAPEIIGLCEIENRFVLNRLVYDTPLNTVHYRIIHYESPDPRGVDVALLYRDEKFSPLVSYPFHVSYPFDTSARTRDILYVKGIVLKSDTLHLFINHWPSRYGGYVETIQKRFFVASLLRSKVDSILLENPEANILIMGDFNDNPDDQSILSSLKAMKPDSATVTTGALINVMAKLPRSGAGGTLKYQNRWFTFDQMILSPALYEGRNRLFIKKGHFGIFNAPFLFEKDETNLGERLFRTYSGPRYLGGFSDHLPVYIDIFISE